MFIAEHEALLGEFYSDLPYPPRARRLLQSRDRGLYPALLSQAVGDFRHERVPQDCSIWVAGCGVNQAVITALKFPGARVLGTDVSEESLRLSLASSRQLGISNLDLRQEKLSNARYREEFDYIICTGVLHHHPDPRPLLSNIAAALRPEGVLEVMVYNTYHRLNQSAFQKAVKLLGDGLGRPCSGRLLANSLAFDNLLSVNISEELAAPEEEFTDAWLNPFEKSYTIESFRALAAACGLDLEAPRITPGTQETPLWDLEFADPEIQDYFEACEDRARWQVVQLLLMELSPMIWFYLRREDSPRKRLADSELNSSFLDAVARQADGAHHAWVLGEDDVYRQAGQPEPSQPVWVGAEFQEFYQALDGKSTVAEICDSLAMPMTPAMTRRMRALLTVPEFPYVLVGRE